MSEPKPDHAAVLERDAKDNHNFAALHDLPKLEAVACAQDAGAAALREVQDLRDTGCFESVRDLFNAWNTLHDEVEGLRSEREELRRCLDAGSPDQQTEVDLRRERDEARAERDEYFSERNEACEKLSAARNELDHAQITIDRLRDAIIELETNDAHVE
jgi:uncharacterized coiled-coil DUF342 family protein